MIDFYLTLVLLAFWHGLFVVPAPKAGVLEYSLLLTLGAVFVWFGVQEHTHYAVTALGIYLVGLGLYFNLTVSASVVSVLVAGASLYLFGGV